MPTTTTPAETAITALSVTLQAGSTLSESPKTPQIQALLNQVIKPLVKYSRDKQPEEETAGLSHLPQTLLNQVERNLVFYSCDKQPEEVAAVLAHLLWEEINKTIHTPLKQLEIFSAGVIHLVLIYNKLAKKISQSTKAQALQLTQQIISIIENILSKATQKIKLIKNSSDNSCHKITPPNPYFILSLSSPPLN